MKYDQLTRKQKEWAYKRWLDNSPLDYPWYEMTIENLKEEGKERGFHITHLWFSGFSSQGDGASWDGHFDLPEYLQWEEKLNVGSVFTDHQLVFLNTAFAEDCLQHRYGITCRGHYSHSHTMQFDDGNALSTWGILNQEKVVEGPLAGMDAALFMETLEAALVGVEEQMMKLCRGYADAAYRDLEKEYEYLLSEEAFKEAAEANDWEFNDAGELNG